MRTFKPVEKFTEWNKREIMGHLMAAECHLSHLQNIDDPDFASCVNKHLNYVSRSEFRELANHDQTNHKKWLHLSKETDKVVNGLIKKTITIKEAKKTVRWIRGEVETVTPGFNVVKCRSCGVDPHGAEEKGFSYVEIEDSLANHVLTHLAGKYNVPKPTLKIYDECNSPIKAAYGNGVIKACRGGVNIHVLAHEFKHHLQRETGQSLNEKEAESFALNLLKEDKGGKSLYANYTNKYSSNGGRVMVNKSIESLKDVGEVYISQVVAEGVTMGLDQLDAMYPGIVLGINPGTAIEALVAVGGAYAAMKRLSAPWDLIVTIIGGYMASDLVQKAATQYGITTPSPMLRYVPTVSVTPSRTIIAPQGALGKYS